MKMGKLYKRVLGRSEGINFHLNKQLAKKFDKEFDGIEIVKRRKENG